MVYGNTILSISRTVPTPPPEKAITNINFNSLPRVSINYLENLFGTKPYLSKALLSHLCHSEKIVISKRRKKEEEVEKRVKEEGLNKRKGEF